MAKSLALIGHGRFSSFARLIAESEGCKNLRSG
jgi:hypothetical protein